MARDAEMPRRPLRVPRKEVAPVPVYRVVPGGAGGKSRNMDRVTFRTFFETFSGFGLIPRAPVPTPRQMSLFATGSTRIDREAPSQDGKNYSDPVVAVSLRYAARCWMASLGLPSRSHNRARL